MLIYCRDHRYRHSTTISAAGSSDRLAELDPARD
jgi:hypothetical protein